MKTKTVVIPYIEFKDLNEALETKKYPHSGLFIVTIKIDDEIMQSDLRVVNKLVQKTHLIVPEKIFNSILPEMEIPEPKGLEVIQMEGEVQGMTANDFILNFSKILLNHK